MSYCIAWKKNEQVFMLSESAISSFEDDIQAGISTFGEVQGLYGKYYVQEGLLKIIKINDDFVLGVSGDVPTIVDTCLQSSGDVDIGNPSEYHHE